MILINFLIEYLIKFQKNYSTILNIKILIDNLIVYKNLHIKIPYSKG